MGKDSDSDKDKKKKSSKKKESSKKKKDSGDNESDANVYSAIFERFEEKQKADKEWIKEFDKLIKRLRKEIGRGKNKKRVEMPRKLPKKVAKFFGKKEMTRGELSSAISEYAKENKLKITKKIDGKSITITKCDKKLADALTTEAFPLKEGSKIGFADNSNLISAIIPPKTSKNKKENEGDDE